MRLSGVPWSLDLQRVGGADPEGSVRGAVEGRGLSVNIGLLGGEGWVGWMMRFQVPAC